MFRIFAFSTNGQVDNSDKQKEEALLKAWHNFLFVCLSLLSFVKKNFRFISYLCTTFAVTKLQRSFSLYV